MFKILKLIVKFSAKPLTVIHPIPLIPTLIAFLSIYSTGICYGLSKCLEILGLSVVYTSSLLSAANLWNHLNDADIDSKFGSKESLDLLENSLTVIVTVIALFFISSLIVLIYAHSLISYYLHAILVVTLWIYSDKIIVGKFLKFRLKEHYFTEVLTYLIVLPTGALVVWSLGSALTTTAIAFSVMFVVFSFSLAMLKDLKDITADEYAGYKTLAVVVNPSKLLRISFGLSFLFYVILFIFVYIVFTRFVKVSMIVLLPSFLIWCYVFYKMNKFKWTIKRGMEKVLKLYPLSLTATMMALCAVCMCAYLATCF